VRPLPPEAFAAADRYSYALDIRAPGPRWDIHASRWTARQAHRNLL